MRSSSFRSWMVFAVASVVSALGGGGAGGGGIGPGGVGGAGRASASTGGHRSANIDGQAAPGTVVPGPLAITAATFDGRIDPTP
jgi:hypothetical protein